MVKKSFFALVVGIRKTCRNARSGRYFPHRRALEVLLKKHVKGRLVNAPPHFLFEHLRHKGYHPPYLNACSIYHGYATVSRHTRDPESADPPGGSTVGAAYPRPAPIASPKQSRNQASPLHAPPGPTDSVCSSPLRTANRDGRAPRRTCCRVNPVCGDSIRPRGKGSSINSLIRDAPRPG